MPKPSKANPLIPLWHPVMFHQTSPGALRYGLRKSYLTGGCCAVTNFHRRHPILSHLSHMSEDNGLKTVVTAQDQHLYSLKASIPGNCMKLQAQGAWEAWKA